MSGMLSQIAVLVGKDLRIEGRTRQTLGIVLVLGILIASVLGLGLSSQPQLAAMGRRRFCGWRICSAACCALKKRWRSSGRRGRWRDCFCAD